MKGEKDDKARETNQEILLEMLQAREYTTQFKTWFTNKKPGNQAPTRNGWAAQYH